MASKELQNLVKAMVKQAYDEGIKVTELNELIREYREEIGLCRQGPKGVVQYREATEEEKKFKEEVYDFFSKEISLEEATSKELKKRGHKMCEYAYKSNLLFFSEIMCAAKMLARDGEKITSNNIMNILWDSNRYTNYNQLLSDIGYGIKSMKEIAINKWYNNTWEQCIVTFSHSPIAVTIGGYFKLLEKNGIQ